MKLFLVLSFALAVVSADPTPEAIEALEVLKLVQSETLDLEEKVAKTIAIADALIQADKDDDKVEFRQQVDKYITVLDFVTQLPQRENLFTKVLKWVEDEIESEPGLVFPLRAPRLNLWTAETSLKQLVNTWLGINAKFDRSPDLEDKEKRLETVINVQLFTESLSQGYLKDTMVRIRRAIVHLERYILSK